MDAKFTVIVCKKGYFFEVYTIIDGYLYTYVEKMKNIKNLDFNSNKYQVIKAGVIKRAEESFLTKMRE